MNNNDKKFERFHLPLNAKRNLNTPQHFIDRLRDGEQPYQLLEFSEDVMEEFYQAACFLLGEKKYKESANAFLFLVGLNPYQYDFWLGLGMSEQLCHEYETAIDAYEIAAICNLSSPVPYFYLAKCLFAIHDRESALEALNLAIDTAGDEEEYSEIREQSEVAKRTLEAM